MNRSRLKRLAFTCTAGGMVAAHANAQELELMRNPEMSSVGFLLVLALFVVVVAAGMLRERGDEDDRPRDK
jgi:hypothetical protein